MPDLRVLHHAQCFDGFASAAVFTAFYDKYTLTENNVAYRGLRHGPNSRLQEHLFDCPVNAVVDFRYIPKIHYSVHWTIKKMLL